MSFSRSYLRFGLFLDPFVINKRSVHNHRDQDHSAGNQLYGFLPLGKKPSFK